MNYFHLSLSLLLFIIANINAFYLNAKPRIYGGKQADLSNFQYQVSLRVTEISPFGTVRTNHFCGGSLISDWFILTAAHCFKKKDRLIDQIRAVLGTHLTYGEGDMYNISKIINHPSFIQDKYVGSRSFLIESFVFILNFN